MRNQKLTSENTFDSIETNKIDENDNLIDYNTHPENEEKSESFLLKIPKDRKSNNNSKCNFSNLPFIFYFFIIIIIFTIILIIRFISLYTNYSPNFRIENMPGMIPPLNDRKYQYYIFNNSLEVLLIQDPKFDMDGGAILIENGYLDNPLDEGIASFACNLLTHMSFEDIKNITTIQDYFGTFLFEAQEHFTFFSFDILNNGYKKFLSIFSQILNLEDKNISSGMFDIIKQEIDTNYQNSIDIYEQENHLLEYLVYGFKNESGDEILPMGNRMTLDKYSDQELEEKVKEYFKQIIDPKKIKIVLFSKYKFLISAKYMKKYFRYLTTIKLPNNTNTEKKYEINEFNKSQIIFIKSEFSDPNFIDIIYFIDKKINESYSELFYKDQYFYYIKDFFDETKEGSLYSLLTNNSNFNIKSIYVRPDLIILKSKIKFLIHIELNCLKNINDIIFITHQFMDKIVKEAIGKNLRFDRYKELKDLCYQDQIYKEKTFDTIDLAKNNARNLIDTKYIQQYYFHFYCVPWNYTENITEIKEIIINESEYYFNQLRPENSVVVISIREKDIDKLTCNNNSKFFLNCTDLKDNNMNKSFYYNVYYKNYFFNSSELEKYLSINNTANISFSENIYKSKHNESCIPLKENIILQKNYSNNEFNRFIYKRDVNFSVPKVFISLNLLHPYLRPMNNNSSLSKCYYFQIIEMFSAIKRKINSELADLMRAFGEIYFGQDENYLYINIFCYNDVAFKIISKIKEIIFDTNWESTDFIINNEIYKNEAYDDFFNLDNNIQDISRNYFYSKLKNGFLNKYEFSPKEFEEMHYNNCISDINITNLTAFMVNGYIYGNYTTGKVEDIANLFNSKDKIPIFNNLLKIINNDTEVTSINFANWTRKINELNHNITVDIDINSYINSNDTKYGIRYICFPKDLDLTLNISIFEKVFKNMKVEDASKILNLEIIKYNNIYFELILFTHKNITIPNDEFVKEEWEMRLKNYEDLNTVVDNIGNRYYYIKKNFFSALTKQQTSLYKKANDILKNYLYEGTELDPEEIMKEYNKQYSNKRFDFEELQNLKESFSDINGNKRIDIRSTNK